MMSKVLILSDIHGNLSALLTVLQKEQVDRFDGIILLGDIIDYGPHSNEVIKCLQRIPRRLVLVNIWGNHEYAIANKEYERFSCERGKKCAQNTTEKLKKESLEYLYSMECAGKKEFQLSEKKCLAVHGSLEDPYWKSISYEEMEERYAAYDIVFSGHSHVPHYITRFYNNDDENYRFKKKTIFLNPGSVGQPRNHNPNAHYIVLDTENMSVQLNAVSYDVDAERKCFSDEIDDFYKERLIRGI